MRRMLFLILTATFSLMVTFQGAAHPRSISSAFSSAGEFRRLPAEVYRQKMIAAWLGQMFGVSYGQPTEFRYLGRMIPEAELPPIHPGMINEAFEQDDLYVEMTFLRTLDTYGLDVSAAQAGIDFANSEYQLWFANLAARDNLRAGIAPPDSGHPVFSAYSDDIDFQIEADFAGLISPGMPNRAITLGETFGGIMNYGDGLYAGQFVACMYAESFFETDPLTIVRAGLDCIPAESQYAEAIRNVITWWQEAPTDWQATWTRINDQYNNNPAYRQYSSNEAAGTPRAFNIDAKINGAFVVMGLLYGGGDLLTSMTIAMRSGQDSDCNPATVGGILAAAFGDEELVNTFTAELDTIALFSYTDYRFDDLIAVTERLARQSIVAAGGAIEIDSAGNEIFLIPLQSPEPSPFVQSWNPGPIMGSYYTDAEMSQIHFDAPRSFTHDVARFAPGWAAIDCVQDDLFGLYPALLGRSDVLLTQPLDKTSPCRLMTQVQLTGASPSLHISVGHYPDGEWQFSVLIDGQPISEMLIGSETTQNGWVDLSFDLSAFAGQTVLIELLNQDDGGMWNNGYWAGIALGSS
ncbi:MAG: ADP-ribosylglycohydrolase family protein [Anaerolineae bacterium]|nr:ADP-ribosylglycohydrolase family protein [Anaerolineae bacterium]